MGLAQIGPMQTQFGMQMGQAELGQANQMRSIRLALLNQFLQNFQQEQASKKEHERRQTEQQQGMAMGAGSLLAAVMAPPGFKKLAGLFGGKDKDTQMTSPGGGLGDFSLDDILKLGNFGGYDQFLSGRPQMR